MFWNFFAYYFESLNAFDVFDGVHCAPQLYTLNREVRPNLRTEMH